MPLEKYTKLDLASCGLLTQGSVGDDDCILTVDTGSNISIVHPVVLRRFTSRAAI